MLYTSYADAKFLAIQGGFDVYLRSKMCYPKFCNMMQVQV